MPSPSNVHQFTAYREAFELGLTEVYKDELEKLPRQYAPWLSESPAQHFFDTDWIVSGLGVMPEKDIGGRIETDKIIKGPTKQYDLQTYALGLVIQFEVYRWDLYGVFPGIVRELAKSATDRYNLVAYKFLNDSFTTTDSVYQTFQAEVPVTSTHTRLDGGTWSNELTGNEGLSYEGIQKAITLLRKLVNERGRFVSVEPKILITSVDQEWLAATQIHSALRPSTTDNDINTIKGAFDIHTSVYLTAVAPWWLQCNKGNSAFKVKMRLGDNPDLVRDQEPNTRNRIMTSYCSFRFATFDTRGIVGSTGGA